MRNLIVILLIVVALPSRSQAQQAPNRVFTEVGLDQNLGSWAPLNLTFQDESGHSVALRSLLRGRPVVLALVYYECPMICTEVLNGMVRSFKQLPMTMGEDYDVVTISINPNEKSPLAAEKKATYLKLFGHPENVNSWHFLTGADSCIKPLAAAVGYRYVYDTATSQYAHPTGIIVLTPKGQVARYLYGVDYPPKDLKFALVEASGNKVGSAVDKILLLCYHYDPMTGKYGFVVLNALKIGGGVTVLAMGIVIAFYLRQDRKKKKSAGMLVEIRPVNGSAAGVRH